MADRQNQLGFSEPNFSWDEYVEVRPQYPDELLQLLYSYHARYSCEPNSWDTAMDIGAGHGIIAEKLARRFLHVAVCEPNEEYLAFAARRLSNLDKNASELSFHPTGAEEKVLSSGSVDLLTMGMCIHWTDPAESVATAAYHLKPGGTLSVIYYRAPYLDGNRKAAELWDEMWEFAIDEYVSAGGMDNPVNLRSWRLECGGMDGVGLPREYFCDVERIKLNTKWGRAHGLPFAMSRKHASAASSAVTDDEAVIEKDDYEHWTTEKVDAAWLMRSMKSYFAGRLPFAHGKELELIEKLKKALESSNGVVNAIHPVSIVLATRR